MYDPPLSVLYKAATDSIIIILVLATKRWVCVYMAQMYPIPGAFPQRANTE